MAKVLFIANAVVNFTKYSFDSFYEGFINALTRNGNDVYFMKANLFLDQEGKEQNFQINIKKNKVISYLKNLEPELIITFNNNITKDILDNTGCPVVFWSSESYDFLVSKDLIKKYESRYLFLHFDDYIRNQFIDNLHVNPKNNITTLLSTDVRAKKIKQDKNISFLGTLHGSNDEFDMLRKCLKTQKNRDLVLELLERIENAPLNSINLAKLHSKTTKISLMNTLSRYRRLTTLDALSDLDLHIYGGKKWLKVFDTFPYLSLSYRDGCIYTIDEVSDLYNSSKISINAAHIHSVSNLSYRVPDIMASNAVLLNKGKINKRYDPQGLIPHFNSPSEAKDLAIKIIKNPNYRKNIVDYCHKIVEAKLRFEHRLKEIEEILPIKLLHLSPKQGKYHFIDPDDFVSIAWKTISNANRSIMNLLPKSAISISHKLVLPFSKIIPEDIKRIYRDLG